MKVLHVTNNYPTPKFPIFGIFVKEQIDSLTEIGIQNEVFFINGRESGWIEYIKSIIKLRKHLRANRYDLIHCHHGLSAICYILSGYSKGNKSIVSFQNDPINELGSSVFKYISNHTHAIILKNNSELIDDAKIFYRPNGVMTNTFTSIPRNKCISVLKLNPEKTYILFVSSNFKRKQKRYELYSEVIQVLKNKYGLKDVEELSLINIKRELVPYYFGASSLHLLTSSFEGSPNSVKEAMACNVPVVSTNVGNVQDLLAGVKGSFISETSSAKELAELSYKAIIYRESKNGRNMIFEKGLDIMSVAKKILTIYREVVLDD